jgi:predicted permease
MQVMGESDGRTDLVTASRVDLALILLPLVGWLATSVTLAVSGVPADVAVRVLVMPAARRDYTV